MPLLRSIAPVPAWMARASLVLLCLLAAGPPVASATAPGRNGRIAFLGEHCGSRAIFTIRDDGSRARRVSRGACRSREAVNPSWSPHGRRILFFQYPGFVVADDDGSDARGFTEPVSEGRAYRAEWAPGGSELAWSFSRGDFDGVFIGTRRDRQSRFLEEGLSPSWSPNGRSIAMLVPDDTDGCGRAIAIFNASTGARRRTILAGSDARYGCAVPRSLDWSPSGRWILFASAGSTLDLIRPDGTDRRRVKVR